jgi:hypothetical protein
MIEALSNDGIVEDSVLQSAIDEAKTVASVTKPISDADVADYSFLREAIKRQMLGAGPIPVPIGFTGANA